MRDDYSSMQSSVWLRSVQLSDAALIVEQWLPGGLDGYSFPADKYGMAELIAQWIAGEVANQLFLMFMIECVGGAAGLLSLYEQDGALSVGVSVLRKYRNRGIAVAAVRASVPLARDMGYTRLVAQNRTDNWASIALCQKCGFQCVGKGVNARGKEVFYWELRL